MSERRQLLVHVGPSPDQCVVCIRSHVRRRRTGVFVHVGSGRNGFLFGFQHHVTQLLDGVGIIQHLTGLFVTLLVIVVECREEIRLVVARGFVESEGCATSVEEGIL